MVSQKVQDGSEKLAAIVYILSNKILNAKSSSEREFLLKCLLGVSSNLSALPSNKDIPQKVLDILDRLTSEAKEPSE